MDRAVEQARSNLSAQLRRLGSVSGKYLLLKVSESIRLRNPNREGFVPATAVPTILRDGLGVHLSDEDAAACQRAISGGRDLVSAKHFAAFFAVPDEPTPDPGAIHLKRLEDTAILLETRAMEAHATQKLRQSLWHNAEPRPVIVSDSIPDSPHLLPTPVDAFMQAPWSSSAPSSPLTSRPTTPSRLFLPSPKQSRPASAGLDGTRRLHNPFAETADVGSSPSSLKLTIRDELASRRFTRPGLSPDSLSTLHPALTTQLFGRLPPGNETATAREQGVLASRADMVGSPSPVCLVVLVRRTLYALSVCKCEAYHTIHPESEAVSAGFEDPKLRFLPKSLPSETDKLRKSQSMTVRSLFYD